MIIDIFWQSFFQMIEYTFLQGRNLGDTIELIHAIYFMHSYSLNQSKQPAYNTSNFHQWTGADFMLPESLLLLVKGIALSNWKQMSVATLSEDNGHRDFGEKWGENVPQWNLCPCFPKRPCAHHTDVFTYPIWLDFCSVWSCVEICWESCGALTYVYCTKKILKVWNW